MYSFYDCHHHMNAFITMKKVCVKEMKELDQLFWIRHWGLLTHLYSSFKFDWKIAKKKFAWLLGIWMNIFLFSSTWTNVVFKLSNMLFIFKFQMTWRQTQYARKMNSINWIVWFQTNHLDKNEKLANLFLGIGFTVRNIGLLTPTIFKVSLFSGETNQSKNIFTNSFSTRKA